MFWPKLPGTPLRPKNWYSPKWELDFFVWNWTSSKMTFTVNIHTHKTIIEHNFDRKLGHVSKYGKLFCIFPIVSWPCFDLKSWYKMTMIPLLNTLLTYLRKSIRKKIYFCFNMSCDVIRDRSDKKICHL